MDIRFVEVLCIIVPRIARRYTSSPQGQLRYITSRSSWYRSRDSLLKKWKDERWRNFPSDCRDRVVIFQMEWRDNNRARAAWSLQTRRMKSVDAGWRLHDRRAYSLRRDRATIRNNAFSVISSDGGPGSGVEGRIAIMRRWRVQRCSEASSVTKRKSKAHIRLYWEASERPPLPRSCGATDASRRCVSLYRAQSAVSGIFEPHT